MKWLLGLMSLATNVFCKLSNNHVYICLIGTYLIVILIDNKYIDKIGTY
jgi:hypothetical protein